MSKMTRQSQHEPRLLEIVTIIILLIALTFLQGLTKTRLDQVLPSVWVASGAGQTGNLTVVVSGVAKPVQGATVTLLPGQNGASLPGPLVTDINGTVTFTGLPAGTYSYRVDASGYSSIQNSATVTAGQDQQSLVTLQFANASPGTPLVLYYVLGGIVGLGIVLYLLRRKIWKKKRGTWGEEDYFRQSWTLGDFLHLQTAKPGVS